MMFDFSAWIQELNEQKGKHPLSIKTFRDAIPPQYAIQVLDELTNGQAIISTGVGQHQMLATQFYKYNNPRGHGIRTTDCHWSRCCETWGDCC
ncbi:Agglutinin-like protein 1 precursor [Dionaea muscipula]